MENIECETSENKFIDRFNPFSNKRENRFYSDDYRKIEPLISLKDFSLPVKPSNCEKKNIRKHYNRVGGFMLLHLGMSYVLVTIFSVLAGVLLFSYPDSFEEYVENSSIEISVSAMTFIITNIVIFLVGCGICGYKKEDFFRKSSVSYKRSIFRYIIIALFLQQLASIIYIFAETFFTETVESSQEVSTSGKIIVEMLYGCIAAPITEELVFRGLMLKNLSKVSQGFGIFMSAFLFGLFHGNIFQFITGFLCGIIFGYVVVKYNSLTPAIILHMVVNLSVDVRTMVLNCFSEEVSSLFVLIYIVFILVAGFAAIIYSIVCKDIPPHSDKLQRKRTLPLALTSWLFVFAAIAYVICIV